MHIAAVSLVAVLVLPAAPFVAAAQIDADDKAAADLVAVQVREQGYACDEPTSATREQDQDGDAVWRLDCQNASYRVRLVPDMAAAIERID